MPPPVTTVQHTLSLDSIMRTLVGCGISALVVSGVFFATDGAVLVVKEGAPKAFATFIESLSRTTDRLARRDISVLFTRPGDLGFPLAIRRPLLHSGLARSDYGGTPEVTLDGSNLDVVTSIEIAGIRLTEDDFAFRPQVGDIQFDLQGELPKSDTVYATVRDGEGNEARCEVEVIVRSSTAVASNQDGPASSTDPQTSGGGSGTGSEKTPDRDPYEGLKLEVLQILREGQVAPGVALKLELEEATLEKGGARLLARLLRTVLEARNLDEGTRRELLAELLKSRLFQKKFYKIGPRKIARLMTLSTDRLFAALVSPKAMLEQLSRIDIARPIATDPSIESGEGGPSTGAGGPRLGREERALLERAASGHIDLQTYDRIYATGAPLASCQETLRRLEEDLAPAARAGRLPVQLDVAFLVERGELPFTPVCPESGDYTLQRGIEPPIRARCSKHGALGAVSPSYRKFGLLFDDYERVRLRLQKNSQDKEAVNILEETRKSQPGNPYVLRLLGRLYFERRSFDKVPGVIRHLADRKGTDLTLHYWTGFSYYATKDIQQAKRYLTRAAETPSSPGQCGLATYLEYHLLRDRASWVLDFLSKDVRFIDFAQKSEPLFPSERCHSTLQALYTGLTSMLPAFQKMAVQQKLTRLKQRVTTAAGEDAVEALSLHVRALARDYASLFPEELEACRARGRPRIARQGLHFELDCTAHPHLLEGKRLLLAEQSGPFVLRVVNSILGLILTRSDPSLRGCLQHQAALTKAREEYTGPSKWPSLLELAREAKLSKPMLLCPLGGSYTWPPREDLACPYHFSRASLLNALEHLAGRDRAE